MSSAVMRAASAAAEIVVRRWREPAFRVALSVTGNRELAEDVAQEVLVRLAKHWTKLETEEITRAWVRKTAVRRALTLLQSKRRHTLPEIPPDLDGAKLDPTDAVAVQQTLAKLKPEQRALLGLVIAEGWTYAEVGVALGIPEGTVGSRLHAAKEAFREAWQEEVK